MQLEPPFLNSFLSLSLFLSFFLSHQHPPIWYSISHGRRRHLLTVDISPYLSPALRITPERAVLTLSRFSNRYRALVDLRSDARRIIRPLEILIEEAVILKARR